MANIDPIFIKISENLDTEDILDDLIADSIEVKINEELNIGGRTYIVQSMFDENGNYNIKKSKDDLKGNLRAYEELERATIIKDFPLDDLCLRNKKNGNVGVEVQVPASFYEKIATSTNSNQLFDRKQRNFFVRFDSSMLNTTLRDKNVKFEKVGINMTPCMFATDSAIVITKSGKRIPITERSTTIEEEVKYLYTYPRFTFYEREIVARLVGTINILAFNGKIDEITTVLPRGAYYSFLFEISSNYNYSRVGF